MNFNLSNLLRQFSQERRILRTKFSPNSGTAAASLVPHQLQGSEGLCEALDYRLRCLGSDISTPLKSLIGLPLAVSIENQSGIERNICAIVTGASQLAADGGLVLFELHLQDGLSILQNRTTWRVFRNRSVRDITETLLKEHRDRNSVLAKSFDFDLSGFQHEYAAREFTMQAGESDHAFLTRLWRREGICWYFSHAVTGEWPVHTLHFADSINTWQDNPAGTVRFHRADATEVTDSVTAWQAHRQIVPGSYSIASHDYQANRLSANLELASIDQGEAGNALAASLSNYRYAPPHMADSQAHLEHVVRRRLQAYEQAGEHYSGEGVQRDFSGAIGSVFTLSGHPEIDSHPADERRFVLTRVVLTARNNLLLDSAVRNALHLDADGAVYSNQFDCVRTGVVVAPVYDPSCVPNVGPMSARVVGDSGKEIDVDEQGRIAVRFLFAQEEEHATAGASESTADSARIRVAQSLADAGFGATFWPRVGSEVLIDFLQNDPDKPIVVGNIHNALKPPTRFSGTSKPPTEAALSGIRTQEVKGTAYGELLFDDSTGETKTKLSAEHGFTQLNQGWIGHPRTDGLSNKRGEGFEMRSDLAGAIRAAQGLLITADGRPKASGRVMDGQELIGQLDVALSIVKQLAELASSHEADTSDPAPAQKLFEQIKGWEADQAVAAAAVAISAPAGIALSSPNAVAASAGTNLDLIAVEDVNVSTGRKLLLRAGQGLSAFVHKAGMKLVAAAGKISIQAQSDELELGAAKRLHAYSLESLLLEAPQIVLRGEGAQIAIGNGKIVLSASAPIEVQGASFSFTGGGGGELDLPDMPQSTMVTDERVAFAGRSGKARENLQYEVRDKAGAVQDAGKAEADGAIQSTVTDSVIKSLTVHLKP